MAAETVIVLGNILRLRRMSVVVVKLIFILIHRHHIAHATGRTLVLPPGVKMNFPFASKGLFYIFKMLSDC